MARNANELVQKNFKNGLVTEFTGLNFPEDAVTSCDNVVFEQDGSVSRRIAIDLESGHVEQTVDRTGKAVVGYTWNNAGGNGLVVLRVLQIGTMLYFYRVITGTALSSTALDDTIDLTTYDAGNTAGIAINECQFAATAGYLVVVHPYLEPFYVAFDTSDDSLTGTQITVQIRDLLGLDDTYDVDERVTTTVGSMSDEYKYNLFNQGWYYNSNAALTAWDTARSDLPSSADIWWAYKDTSGAFDAAEVANVDLGNTPAPKGHYLLNVFSQDRSTASGIGSFTVETTGNRRFDNVCFFNGRLFYGGLAYVGHSNRIYFTQVIKDTTTDLGKCYQAGDPTSETSFALQPTDGGWISILGIDSVLKMVPLANQLLIFSTNGVWSISGSSALGFTATDYTLDKLSSIGCLTPSSFLDIEGYPAWWTDEGIYTIEQDETSNELRVVSISDDRIRTFVVAISANSKRYAKGSYNSISKVATWIYNSGENTGDVEDNFVYDRALHLNTITGAWYTSSFNTDLVTIHDIFNLASVGGVQSFETVVDNSNATVQTDAAEDVEVLTTSIAVVPPEFNYAVSWDNGASSYDWTFAKGRPNNYRDFVRYDTSGEDYISYFYTGYMVHGGAGRKFQSNYVYTYMSAATDSSAYMRGVWDWANDASSGNWTTLQQAYNNSTTQQYNDVRISRLKVRGNGRALQLYYVSEDNYPMNIEGWGVYETINEGH